MSITKTSSSGPYENLRYTRWDSTALNGRIGA